MNSNHCCPNDRYPRITQLTKARVSAFIVLPEFLYSKNPSFCNTSFFVQQIHLKFWESYRKHLLLIRTSSNTCLYKKWATKLYYHIKLWWLFWRWFVCLIRNVDLRCPWKLYMPLIKRYLAFHLIRVHHQIHIVICFSYVTHSLCCVHKSQLLSAIICTDFL